MNKTCVCGHPMTRHDWKNQWVCHRCGRTKPIEQPDTYTVFRCRKCEHLLYVQDDVEFPAKLMRIAGSSCPNCGEQDEGLWGLLGRATEFMGEIHAEYD